MVLELSRHPVTAGHQTRVDEYTSVLSLDGMGLDICRDLAVWGMDAARAGLLHGWFTGSPALGSCSTPTGSIARRSDWVSERDAPAH